MIKLIYVIAVNKIQQLQYGKSNRMFVLLSATMFLFHLASERLGIDLTFQKMFVLFDSQAVFSPDEPETIPERQVSNNNQSDRKWPIQNIRANWNINIVN